MLIGLYPDCEYRSEVGQAPNLITLAIWYKLRRERGLKFMAKVKVNHNGGCAGYSFEAGKAFEVRDGDVSELKKALGTDLTVLEADKEDKKEEPTEEKKDAKPDHNKMIGNEQKIEKVVTK